MPGPQYYFVFIPATLVFALTLQFLEIVLIVLQYLMHPVHQFHVRIAPQLAEDGSTFDSPVTYAIELSKQGCATYLSHCQVLSPSSN